jgi:phospholipid transport system transporter-binding protein
MTTLQVVGDGRAALVGPLNFATVGDLLDEGAALIGEGRANLIDLSGVTASDSAGLALMIEWLSVARSAGKSLHFENIPLQLQQLARLSEVEELLLGS